MMKKGDKLIHELVNVALKRFEMFDEDDLVHIQRKLVRDRLYGEKPECFLTIKNKIGQELPMFVICNREGMKDKRFVMLSLKMAEMLDDNYEESEKRNLINRLRNIVDTVENKDEVNEKEKISKFLERIQKYYNKE